MGREVCILTFSKLGLSLGLTGSSIHPIIEAVSDAITDDMQMMIEMHGRFAAHQAVEIAKKIDQLNIGWIEEPVRPSDNPSLEKVRMQTSLPIATGERLYGASEFREIWGSNSVDIIQPDITQCGGIFETKKIASTAEIYSIMVAPHNVGGVVSTLAALHLCITLRNVKILEHFNDFADPFVKEAADSYPEVVDGFFNIPDKPGWGIELDEEFILSHPPEKNKEGINLDPGLNMFEKMDWAKRGQSE
jgi:galactonate dehydratase